ncbi:MAG: isochorismatase family cysteine hydrolase [Nitrospinota bacterium]
MSKEVIIIVDMLKGFLEKGYPLYCGGDARTIIPNVVSLLNEKRGAELIYVCDNHAEDDEEFKMFPRHCIRGTVESELIDELKPFKGMVIPKTRYSGFYNTPLENVLKELNPDVVTVVGVCTDICVMHTVADLRNRDYHVVVPVNCVASFDEDSHRFALKHMEKILGARLV